MRARQSDERGFTLAELLVGVTLALIAGAGAVTFVRAQSLAMQVQAGQADLNDSSRGAIDFMTREIRLAGYAPLPPCPGAPAPGALPAGFGIVSGGTLSLRIQYDLNEDGVIQTGAAASEDVTYQYVAATHTLQRVVGGVASDVVTDLPEGAFQFRYYDSINTEIVPGAGGLTAGQMASVYRVGIRLEPSKVADTRITTQGHASLWTNVGIRSREYHCQ
jgi:type II secretory pathway component PulJ